MPKADLRKALSDPATLPTGVTDWLHNRGIRLSPSQSDLIERILRDAPEHADARALMEALHTAPSSARFRLRKRGLPPPGRWFQLARALHAALLLQAQPGASVASVAERFGFVDHSALTHLLRRTFRTTSREIRGTLGWEWLLHRWWRSRTHPLV